MKLVRSSLITLLVTAFAAVPVVSDWCAASCDIIAGAAAAHSTPSCHHHLSETPRIGHAPPRCGHDHSRPVAVTSAGSISSPARMMLPAIGSCVSPVLSADRVSHAASSGSAIGPPSRSTPLVFSCSLRI